MQDKIPSYADYLQQRTQSAPLWMPKKPVIQQVYTDADMIKHYRPFYDCFLQLNSIKTHAVGDMSDEMCKHTISCEEGFNLILNDYNTLRWFKDFLNYSIDIEKTSFVDLSRIQENRNYVRKISSFTKPTKEIIKEKRSLSNGNTVFCSAFCLELDLTSIEIPFEECFYKISGIKGSFDPENINCINSFLYLKEINPDSMQGIVHLIFTFNGMSIQIPFEVQLKLDYTLKKFILYLYTPSLACLGKNEKLFHDYSERACAVILFCLSKLNRLNQKSNIYRYKGETPKQKYKINGKKEYLRKTVYVYLDKEQEIPIEYTKSKLQREISWLVRGHWRRLVNVKEGTIGKNKRGERNLKDDPTLAWRTWVDEHMCGTGENFQPRTLVVKEGKECSI